MESAEQPTKDLHAKVSDSLTNAGHPTTPANVDPDDNSSLQNVKELFGDAAHVAGSAFEEGVHGANSTTHDRTSPGGKVVSFVQKRMNKLFFSKRNRQQMEKAA